MKPRAFTLIELLIVITITAILSVLLALSYAKLSTDARWNNAKTQVVSLIQKARSLSLSSMLVGGADADYFEVTLSGGTASVDVYGTDGSAQNVSTVTLDSDFSFLSPVSVFYFPPSGDVCFDVDCTDTANSKTAVLGSTDGTHTANFVISVNGGYVNVN